MNNELTNKQRRLKNLYIKRKNAGVCVVCQAPVKPNHTQCKSCLDKQQARYHTRKKQLLDQLLKNGKRIFFTNKEIDELRWIVPGYANTHKEYYEPGENELVENIRAKLNRVI